ncbi:sugar phosphate isomerase/epimerase [Evansella vedderi]|uniref:Sugar phosphate isomerase/epimerase n=1 Tax=Evansella vedderi TaxID=38282 RepID=A0ABT9ZR90_9BACI|nr:sugar phosphate isomerase/epimerase [Evansella vedderi]MDQ0253242.1 sugar phosphate isomerase/epimerase [Evansella vedderi]
MEKIPVAVQLYTLRDECAKDFPATLKKVAELGFDGVEFAGFYGLPPTEVKEILDNLGLKAASSHVPLDQFKNNLEQVIEDHKSLDCQFVAVPFITEEQRTENGYKELIAILNRANEALQKEGLTLCYHNHDFELEQLGDGRLALEAIFDETNVKTELDIYWLTKAGEKPVEWIKRYKGRTPIVHLKDMTTDEEKFFAELGTGGVDIEAVLELGKENDVQWWVVEQDVSRRTPLESVEMSINYLKEKLK